MTEQQRPLVIALVASLLLHGLVLWGALRWKPAAKQRPPQRVTLQVAVVPPRSAPPPPHPVEPTPSPEPAKATKPDPRPAPAPQAPRTPALTTTAPAAVAVAPAPPDPPPPGPPQHKMKSAGSAPAAGSGSGSATGTARKGAVYAPPDYAEKVKQRVNAAIVYPADAKRFLQQCWVEYTLTVDRNGNMLNYKIENCGDDRLDAAAQAALIKGGPYPPPPDSGASSYEIHGAFVFTLR